MKNLYDQKLYLTPDGIEIQNEFESIIKPFFDKYKTKVNPIHLSYLIQVILSMEDANAYCDTVYEQERIK